MSNTLWTPEQTAELRRLNAEEKSASVIGRALGFTRNAILGKLHRLGLCKPREHLTHKDYTKGRKPRLAAFPSAANKAPKAALPPRCDPSEPPTPQGERLTVLELRDGFCRYAIGDPIKEKRVFCGKPCTRVYCEEHMKLCYEPNKQPSGNPFNHPRFM